MANSEDDSSVDSPAGLEGVIGRTPPAIQLKVIDHLDETALLWLRSSPLMFAGWSDGATVSVCAGGGEAGFATGDARTLRLPLALLDDPRPARAGIGNAASPASPRAALIWGSSVAAVFSSTRASNGAQVAAAWAG